MATQKTLAVLAILRDLAAAGKVITSESLASRLGWEKKKRPRNTASAYLSWFARCGFVKRAGKEKGGDGRRWAWAYKLTDWGKRFDGKRKHPPA